MIIGTITIIIIVTDLIIENITLQADRFHHVRLPIAVTTHTHIIIMAMVTEIIMAMVTAIIMDNQVANRQAVTEAIVEIMAQDNPIVA